MEHRELLGPEKRGPKTELGRRYAEELAAETFGLDEHDITTSAIAALPPIEGLRYRARVGPWAEAQGERSELVNPEEAAIRAQEFLKRPRLSFPAEERASGLPPK